MGGDDPHQARQHVDRLVEARVQVAEVERLVGLGTFDRRQPSFETQQAFVGQSDHPGAVALLGHARSIDAGRWRVNGVAAVVALVHPRGVRRWILIAVGVALGGSALALWIAARQATAILVRWQPELERRAGEIAGGPVTIGALSVALVPVAEVVLRDVAVGGARAATVERVSVRARWTPLLRGQVEVLGIEVDRPQIDLHRDAKGYEVVGVPRGAAVAGEAVEAARGALREHESLAVLLGLTLERVSVRDGSLRYQDPSRGLDLTVRDVGLDTRVVVAPRRVQMASLSGHATLADTPIAWQGHDATVDLEAGVATLPQLDVTVAGQALAATVRYEAASDTTVVTLDGDGVALAPLRPLLAQLAPGVAALEPRGTAAPHLHVAVVAADAVPHVDGTLRLTDATLATPAGPLAGIGGTFQVTADAAAAHLSTTDLALHWGEVPLRATVAADTTFTSAQIRQATLAVFGGTVAATGRFGIDTGRYDLDATAQDVDVAVALAALAPNAPRVVTGHVRRLTSQVGGVVGPTALATLRGNGRVEIADGRLLGTNLGQQVFKALDGVPLVGRAVRDALPPELEAVLTGDDTAMTALQANYTIADRVLRLTGVALGNRAFTVDGGGQLDFNGQLDFRGTFRLTPAVTAQLVARVQELKLVVDGDGRMSVPVRVSGPLNRLRVKPEFGGLGLPPATEQLLDRAQDMLRGLFGKRGGRDRK